MAEKELITSEGGGVREALGERWDLIPGGWQSLSEVAIISHYGREKYGKYGSDNKTWKGMDPDSEQSPLNHALAHAYKSLEFPEGSSQRIRQLAKVVWNVLAQIWFEKNRPAEVEIGVADGSLDLLEVMAEAQKDEEIGSLRKLFGKVAG